ncbi:MAG: hypothetical protein IPI04_16195 [Ignavibacteria bacterium]|nr:hypothetical protein [Ignavibacteria bacterium]
MIANQYLSSNGGTHRFILRMFHGQVILRRNLLTNGQDGQGYNNSIIKTTNGGYNWFKQNNGLSITTQLRY